MRKKQTGGRGGKIKKVNKRNYDSKIKSKHRVFHSCSQSQTEGQRAFVGCDSVCGDSLRTAALVFRLKSKQQLQMVIIALSLINTLN